MHANAPRRPHCPRCERPLRTCLCAWVRPIANRIPVTLWMHPHEVTQAKGSAALLRLSLQQCTRVVCPEAGLAAPLPASALPWAHAESGAVLLYPDAPGLASVPPVPGPTVRHLIVIDGTWRQSRQMLRVQPALAALPRWSLPQALLAAHGQRYRVRKAHRPGQLSTLEAVALALGTLEGDAARYQPLLSAFDGWVDTLVQQVVRHQVLPGDT